MGQPWAEVKNDLSKAGYLGKRWKFCGCRKKKKKGRNCQTTEGCIASCDLGGKMKKRSLIRRNSEDQDPPL